MVIDGTDQLDWVGGPAGRVTGGYAGDPGRGPAGETCGTCCHCVRINWRTKNYYKCAMNSFSHSEATDIRLKTAACQFWSPHDT